MNKRTVEKSLVRFPHQFLAPKEGLDPSRAIRAVKFKLEIYEKNPYYFKPSGTIIFCGSQGFGKTLSAVDCATNVWTNYPKAIVCTNLRIKERPVNAYIFRQKKTNEVLKKEYEKVVEDRREDFFKATVAELEEDFYNLKYPEMTVEDYIKLNLKSIPFNQTDDYKQFCIESQYQLRDIATDLPITSETIEDGTFKNVTVQFTGLECFQYVKNGMLGVIFLVDETQNYLNSLESRNISIETITELCQQRKQRVLLIGTAQRINRLAKPLREQFKYLVACKCVLGILQYNRLIDAESIHESSSGEITYDTIARRLWFHSPEQYKRYDTYAVVSRTTYSLTEAPQLYYKEDIYE